MADLPIIFSAPMVRALQREIEAPGTGKTQTRRASKWQPRPCGGKIPGAIYSNDYYWPISEGFGTVSNKPYPPESWLKVHGPRYAVGDRLYVREHWRCSAKHDATAPRDLTPRSMTIAFEAGGSIANQDDRDDWRPSEVSYTDADWMGRFRQGMHMPRWASRITLTVTDVRVQRLNEISEADAIAEGVDAVTVADVPRQAAMSRRSDFASLWNHINGPGAWAQNPWVAAYTFTVARGNIDQQGAR